MDNVNINVGALDRTPVYDNDSIRNLRDDCHALSEIIRLELSRYNINGLTQDEIHSRDSLNDIRERLNIFTNVIDNSTDVSHYYNLLLQSYRTIFNNIKDEYNAIHIE